MREYTAIFLKELRRAWPLFAVYGGYQLVNALFAVAYPDAPVSRSVWHPVTSLLTSFLFVWGGLRSFQGELRDRTLVWMRTFPVSDAIVALVKMLVGALAVFGTVIIGGLLLDLIESSSSVLSHGPSILLFRLVEALSAWCWFLVGGAIGLTFLRGRESAPFVFLWLASSVVVIGAVAVWVGARGGEEQIGGGIALQPAALGHLLFAAPFAWFLKRLYARMEIR